MSVPHNLIPAIVFVAVFTMVCATTSAIMIPDSVGFIGSLLTFAGMVVVGMFQLAASEKIDKVQHSTNSMHDAIVKSAKKESFAAGVKEGEESQQ